MQGREFMTIGKNFGALRNFWISAISCHNGEVYYPKIVIEENVSFGANCHVACINHVSIGSGTLLGSHVHITDHDHGRYDTSTYTSDPRTAPRERPLWSNGPVIIESDVWIGDGVIVLSGVNIGAGSVIGANSVVTRSIAPWSVAVGAPAVVVKQYNGSYWQGTRHSRKKWKK